MESPLDSVLPSIYQAAPPSLVVNLKPVSINPISDQRETRRKRRIDGQAPIQPDLVPLDRALLVVVLGSDPAVRRNGKRALVD